MIGRIVAYSLVTLAVALLCLVAMSWKITCCVLRNRTERPVMAKRFNGNTVDNAILTDEGTTVDVVTGFGCPLFTGVSERDVWEHVEDLPAGAFVIYPNGSEVSIRYWTPACVLADR